MDEVITRKLQGLAHLDDTDVAAIEAVLTVHYAVKPRADVDREGPKAGHSVVILSGWAGRYKILKNGSRQFTSVPLPGDLVDLGPFGSKGSDLSICALSDVQVARLTAADIEGLIRLHPAISRAIRGLHAVDEAMLRAVIIRIGRLDAMNRVGHMLCELWSRALAVGLVREGQLSFPLTQTDLADCIGLTSVHVTVSFSVGGARG